MARWSALVWILGLVTAVPAVFGQAPTTGALLVTVAADDGRALVDLQPDDFIVLDAGTEREILSVRVADYPVILLLDDRSAPEGHLTAVRTAGSGFLSALGDRALAVGTLANPPRMVTTFQDNRLASIRAADTLAPNPTSIVLPIDAVADAAAIIRDVQAPFSAIVVVTERPNGIVEPETLRLLNPILESGAFVYTVALQASGSAVRSPGGALRVVGDLLSDLAVQTGAQYTPVFTAASYGVALNRLVDRLATELIVEFLVPAGGSQTGDVRMGVRIPGARVSGLRVLR